MIEKSLNPNWNFSFVAGYGVTQERLRQGLVPPFKLVVWDKDLLSDDFMGLLGKFHLAHKHTITKARPLMPPLMFGVGPSE